jgi:anthranilate phosphoribosyltransferase
MYAYLYQNTTTNYSILHGLSGFDEVSLTDDVKIISNHSEQILKPIDFNFPSIKLESIKGGNTIDEAAKIFHDVISGKGSVEQNNVVCANAAIAIQTIEKSNYEDALAKAQESLASGKAFEKLNQLIALSK